MNPLKIAITAGVCSIGVAACGSALTQVASVGQQTAHDAAGNAPAAPQAQVPVPKADPLVGYEVTLADGAKIAVSTVQKNVAGGTMFGSTVTAGDGNSFWTANVQQCSSPTAKGATSANPFDWSMQTADNSRVTHGFYTVREPALHATDLAPGQCVRGWITFQVPTATPAVKVVYSGGGWDSTTILRWSIQ